MQVGGEQFNLVGQSLLRQIAFGDWENLGKVRQRHASLRERAG